MPLQITVNKAPPPEAPVASEFSRSSFVDRRIDVTVQIRQAGGTQPVKFADTQTDTVTLRGHRTSFRAQNSGSLAGYEAQVMMWGLSQSLMNQLSTLGMLINMITGSGVTVTAGEAGGSMPVVFTGTIMQAYADYNSAPDVPFRMECRSGAVNQVKPVQASSYGGSTSVESIMKSLATKAGFGFENSGVDTQLSAPYLWGSVVSQIRQVAESARINADIVNGILAIWPLNGSRTQTGNTPLISKDTGMIDYPSFTQGGIIIRSLFNPGIKRGGLVKVASSIFTQEVLSRLQNVESLWTVDKIDLALDAQVPRGQWMMTMMAYNRSLGSPNPTIPR